MNTIRHYEELSFSEWPSHHTLFYDSWILRLAGGYTKRANSINILYGMGDLPLSEKVSYCEAVFRREGVRPTFKLTDLSRGLDSFLEARGYSVCDPSLVMELDHLKTPFTIHKDWTLHTHKDDLWLDFFSRFKGFSPEERDSFSLISDKIRGEVFNILVKDHDLPVACGTGILREGLLAVLNIVTDKGRRGEGWGTVVTKLVLNEGFRRGASGAFLQVVRDNLPAVKIYSNLGFKEIYQYWYRVLD